MLRITASQKDRFSRVTRDSFATRMAAYIRRSFPERVRRLDDAALAAWTRRAAAQCERLRVDREPEAAQTMLLLLVLGVESVEHDTWVASALSYEGAAIGKLRRLVAGCRARNLPIDELLVLGEQLPGLEDPR